MEEANSNILMSSAGSREERSRTDQPEEGEESTVHTNLGSLPKDTLIQIPHNFISGKPSRTLTSADGSWRLLCLGRHSEARNDQEVQESLHALTGFRKELRKKIRHKIHPMVVRSAQQLGVSDKNGCAPQSMRELKQIALTASGSGGEQTGKGIMTSSHWEEVWSNSDCSTTRRAVADEALSEMGYEILPTHEVPFHQKLFTYIKSEMKHNFIRFLCRAHDKGGGRSRSHSTGSVSTLTQLSQPAPLPQVLVRTEGETYPTMPPLPPFIPLGTQLYDDSISRQWQHTNANGTARTDLQGIHPDPMLEDTNKNKEDRETSVEEDRSTGKTSEKPPETTEDTGPSLEKDSSTGKTSDQPPGDKVITTTTTSTQPRDDEKLSPATPKDNANVKQAGIVIDMQKEASSESEPVTDLADNIDNEDILIKNGGSKRKKKTAPSSSSKRKAVLNIPTRVRHTHTHTYTLLDANICFSTNLSSSSASITFYSKKSQCDNRGSNKNKVRLNNDLLYYYHIYMYCKLLKLLTYSHCTSFTFPLIYLAAAG